MTMPHLRIGNLQAVTECLSQKGGGARAEEDGGRRDLGIGHKKTVVLFSRHVESLMFEEKGDHAYVNQDVCARGVPDPFGGVSRQRAQRLSKRNLSAEGLGVLRHAGKW